jgi:hypothetical protein
MIAVANVIVCSLIIIAMIVKEERQHFMCCLSSADVLLDVILEFCSTPILSFLHQSIGLALSSL